MSPREVWSWPAPKSSPQDRPGSLRRNACWAGFGSGGSPRSGVMISDGCAGSQVVWCEVTDKVSTEGGLGQEETAGLSESLLTFSLLRQPGFQVPRCPERRTGQACSLPGKKGVTVTGLISPNSVTGPVSQPKGLHFFPVLFYLEGGSKVCIGAGLEDPGHEDLGLLGLRGYALAPRSNMSWLVPGPSSEL